MFGYVAIYNGKRIELYADSLYRAKCKAIEEFKKTNRKKINENLVSVVLCERPDGSQVIHTPDN